ncbi:hypothetical protein HYD86_03805 [Mycoplasmopsis bovis]|nr:hypothetical protein [Mycoplasmopsis bovis]QQH36962.1 hypothetical protein HYD86_03805 [Mycoplasmopsis bovis]
MQTSGKIRIPKTKEKEENNRKRDKEKTIGKLYERQNRIKTKTRRKDTNVNRQSIT